MFHLQWWDGELMKGHYDVVSTQFASFLMWFVDDLAASHVIFKRQWFRELVILISTQHHLCTAPLNCIDLLQIPPWVLAKAVAPVVRHWRLRWKTFEVTNANQSAQEYVIPEKWKNPLVTRVFKNFGGSKSTRYCFVDVFLLVMEVAVPFWCAWCTSSIEQTVLAMRLWLNN